MMYKYSRIHSYGPLTIISAIFNDKLSRPIRERVLKFKKKNCPMSEAASASSSVSSSGNPAEFKRMMQTTGIDDITPVTNTNLNVDISDPRSDSNAHEQKPISEVIVQIIRVLPPPKVTWLLIERFFKYAYPLMPYLDQKSFYKDVQRIIDSCPSNQSEIKTSTLKLSRRMDLSIIGQLLIVLKLSYMTLNSNLETPDDFPSHSSDELYLLSKDLNSDIIDVAQSCLDQFNLLSTCAIPIFQCALLMFEYKKIDTFQGFVGFDAHIYINLLLNIAVAIGLNKDPDLFDPVVGNSPLGNLWRKIWYGLIAAEHVLFCESGSSKGVMNNSFNTKLPLFKSEYSNNFDDEIEKKSIERISNRYRLHCKVNSIIDLCVKMDKPTTMGPLITGVLDLEDMVYKKYGSLKDLLKKDFSTSFIQRINKVFELIDYLQTISSMQPIYFKILQKFDSDQNLIASKFFTFKMLSIFMFVLFNFHELVCHSYRYFGIGFDHFTTPVIEVVIHKSWFILTTVSCKVMLIREELESLPQSSENAKKLNELNAFKLKVTNFTDSFYLPSLNILSQKYFYAWRMLKAHKFIISLLRDKQLDYTNEERKSFNFIRFLNSEDLTKLNELLNLNNYDVRLNPSNFGKAMLERYKNNICDEDSRFPPLNFKTIPNEPSVNISPLDGEVDLAPTDDFWFDMFNKFGSNNNNNTDTYLNSLPNYDFNDIAAEYGLSNNEEEKLELHTTSNIVNKDAFVDQTIFDMFNL